MMEDAIFVDATVQAKNELLPADPIMEAGGSEISNPPSSVIMDATATEEGDSSLPPPMATLSSTGMMDDDDDESIDNHGEISRSTSTNDVAVASLSYSGS